MTIPLPNIDYVATGWWYVDFDPVGGHTLSEPEARAPCPRREPGLLPHLGAATLAWMDEGLGLWVPQGGKRVRLVGGSGQGDYGLVVWYKFEYIPGVTRRWVISPVAPQWPNNTFVFAAC